MMRRFSTSTLSAVAAAAQGRSLTFTPRTREYQFLMDEVLDLYPHYEKLGKADVANKDFIDTVGEECAKVCTQTLFPIYESGDVGCQLKDGKVTTPKGFKDAWHTYVEGGWQGLCAPEEFGGQGLPQSAGYPQKEMMATANWPWFMYPGLSAGAIATISSHGTDEQKELYLKKLIAGEWTGTMCLTEPHCGTDLAQITTKAAPQPDGSYKITGTKIFISSGDHDFTDNIVHVVLAKLPDAPKGTKGISLFIVPRHVVNKDGSLQTERNVVSAGLENKMGIKGNSTLQLAFEGSTGYIVGGPHEGMKQMFTFMNMARIGTAVQGVAHAELAFQNALHYARERPSMRALSGAKNADKPSDLIHNHPGVRHQVLFCKSIAEAGRAFALDMSRVGDLYQAAKTPSERAKWDAELGIMTPIAKGALTELGLESASMAVQTYGGHGFIKGNGVEQILRDARIATLYEGTTGVQGLDLLGRKVLINRGANLAKFHAKMQKEAMPFLTDFRGPLGKPARQLYFAVLRGKLALLSIVAGSVRDKEMVGAAAQDFLMFNGYLTLGYYWLRMAAVAQKKVAANQDPDGFYQTKIDTCQFYFARVFPRSAAHNEIMLARPKEMMSMNIDKVE